MELDHMFIILDFNISVFLTLLNQFFIYFMRFSFKLMLTVIVGLNKGLKDNNFCVCFCEVCNNYFNYFGEWFGFGECESLLCLFRNELTFL